MDLRRTTFGLAVLGMGVGVAPGCGGTVRNFDASEAGGKGGASGLAGKPGSEAGEAGEFPTDAGTGGAEAGAAGAEAGAAGAEAGAAGAEAGGTTGLGGTGNGGTGNAGTSNAGTGGGVTGNAGTGGSVVTVAPNTSLTSTPPNPDKVTSPTFQFSSTIANSTFQCKLDSGNYAACVSPRAVTISGDGQHSFSVYASAAGVDDATPATYTWTLDTVAPTLQITASPAAITSTTAASFGFTAETGATVACRVDTAAFGACTSVSTHNLTGLAVGNHTFEVRATDAANNQIVKSFTWYIEPPCVGVLIEAEALLPATGWSLASGSVLHNNNAIGESGINSAVSFTFQGKGLIVYYRKGPSAGKHTVSIDGGAALTITATDAAGWSYQQPTTVATGLTSAVHTATVTCITSSCQIDYFAVTCL